ncbi:AMP-binding protein [Christensenellaceae bacterium OttesenSCG-928-K19]|nr:AMP-binding protein [Christensenellaceae bacterium OttesenSCG-928-K19]
MTHELYEIRNYGSFRELMETCPAVYQGRDMFREKDGEGIKNTSCEEFADIVNSLGAALLEKGLADGKIAVIGETSVKWIATYFAAVCGGGVIVPVDKELPEDEIANVLNDSGAAAVVYSATFKEVMESIKGSLPNVECFIGMAERDDASAFLSFDRLVEHGKTLDQTAYKNSAANEGQLSSLLYTSGTTGKSKGVMLTQKNILSAAAGELRHMRPGKVCMSVLPIHHSYEFAHGIMMEIMGGVTICINDSPRYFLQNLQLFKPDMLTLVPLYVEMMYRKIWANAKANGGEEQLKQALQKSEELMAQGVDKRRELFKDIIDALGGNLKLIICGGAPLAAFYSKAFRDFGILLLQGYGITECSPLVSVNPDWENKDGSIGLPISCCRVTIREEAEDGSGEIWVKGDNVMLGYYKNPQATAEVLQDGWFNTGDIGHLDEDGYLFITGRKKNLIVLSNGKNVYPEEIEGYLMRIPYIKEVVVYAPLADGLSETGLVAEIYPEETHAAQYTAEELQKQLENDIAEVNKSLPGYKQVHEFKLRDTEFEKTTKKSIKRFVIKH